RTVLPVDMYAGPSVTLMTPEPGVGEDVQALLQEAAAARDDRLEWLGRFDFYERGRRVFAVVRTLERRKYGCIMLRKGVVGDDESGSTGITPRTGGASSLPVADGPAQPLHPVLLDVVRPVGARVPLRAHQVQVIEPGAGQD